MALEFLEMANGIFSIILVTVFSLVGIRIMLIYRRQKSRVYLFVGFTLMGLGSPWYSSSTSFIMSFFNNDQGLTNLPIIYFLLAIPILPIITLSWTMGFTEILYKERQKLFRNILLILGIIIEILFLLFMILDPNGIVTLTTPVNADYSRLILIYVLCSLIYLLYTGVLLARSGIKLNEPEPKLKGYFLILAYILYFIGAIFDSLIDFTDLLLLLPRILLVAAVFCFYCGFNLPKTIKKIFLKNK